MDVDLEKLTQNVLEIGWSEIDQNWIRFDSYLKLDDPKYTQPKLALLI